MVYLIRPFRLFVLFALIISIYLFYSHIRNHLDIGFRSFCAISKSYNCDTVAQSRWSVFMGLPVAVWGIFSFTFLLISTFYRKNDGITSWFFLFSLSSFFSIISIILAFVSGYIIKSYCIMCVIIYSLNFSLFFISFRAVYNSGTSFFVGLKNDLSSLAGSRLVISCLCFLVAVLLLLYLFMPRYWLIKPVPLDGKMEHGFDDETLNPWIGSKTPKLTIYEYSDYTCFQCRKMHNHLRKLIASYPDKIRLVHLNYPMDSEFNNIVVPDKFHEGAGRLALISEYASERDDFWKISDALFEIGAMSGNNTIEKISAITGLTKDDLLIALNHEILKKSLAMDIRSGMKKFIFATPSYVIDEKVYEGVIPPEIFKRAGIE